MRIDPFPVNIAQSLDNIRLRGGLVANRPHERGEKCSLAQEDLWIANEGDVRREGNAGCVAGGGWREDLNACHCGVDKLDGDEGIAGFVLAESPEGFEAV